MSSTEAPALPLAEAGCGIAAFGIVTATVDQLPALRKHPEPRLSRPLPAGVLKYADDQTVAALAAVLRAVAAHSLEGCDFTDWAVVAAPRFLGRVAFAGSIDKFQRQGAASVSPLIVPYLSLHAVAGTISVALQSHGPALGVGGGTGGLAEALLTGLTVAAEHQPPGVWVVLSHWDPEPIADKQGRPIAPAVGRALALALVPFACGPGLCIRCAAPAAAGSAGCASADGSAPTLASLTDFLLGERGPGRERRWLCPLRGGGQLEVTDTCVGGLPASTSPQPALAA